MKLPVIHRQNSGRAILFGYLLFCCLYLFAGHFYFSSPTALVLSDLDRLIPLIPWSIIIYLSQFLLLFLALWLPETTERTIVYYAMLLATIIASMVFLLYPTELPRPVINSYDWLNRLWQGLFIVDTSTNCFPSLHVALATLAAIALRTRNRFWRWLAPGWATLIVVSTLTTKQHCIVDIIGGVALAGIAITITKFSNKNIVYETY